MIDIDLIVEYPNVLDVDTCNKIIEKFDNDPDVYDGIVGQNAEIKDVKVSRDLHISRLCDWKEYDKIFYDAVSEKSDGYIDLLRNKWNVKDPWEMLQDTGYQIQKTEPGGHYHWHSDDSMHLETLDLHTSPNGVIQCAFVHQRLFTFILYLNDVDVESNAGRTQFYMGENQEPYSVRPEAGKLLLFPANVIYSHRGETLTGGLKYLMTGWVSRETLSRYRPVEEPPTAPS